MIEFPSNCTGCTTCSCVCPKQAIEMVYDKRGFLKPIIKSDAECIDCNLCLSKCPMGKSNKLSIQRTFAVKNRRIAMRKKSQSGGYAYVLSKHVIDKGGVVYGAALTKDFFVSHIRVENEGEIEKLCGSKYTQSDLRGIFASVKKDIKDNKEVSFIGLPCQVAGLKTYLGNSGRLITVDLICSGAPSQKVWLSYVQWQKEKHWKADALRKVVFRDTEVAWGGKPREAFWFGEKKESFNYFLRIFASHNADREVCFKCPYATKERVGDMTIGDYWGIERVAPDFLDDYGVSLVLINSEKGMGMYREVESEVDSVEISIVDACNGNPRLLCPQKRPDTYDEFWKVYCNKNFGHIIRRYGKVSVFRKIKKVLKDIS